MRTEMLIKWPMPPTTVLWLKKTLAEMQKRIDLEGEEMMKEIDMRFGLKWEEE